ncbi:MULTISPECIES: competence pheromone ComX [Bacillus]|uniref:competence pheromone ComX n=1 Tax=Bacillus TaxID=1386 RepID=UPI0015834072|nr:competence pheromone ComX [Bacillus glycinifermentans]MBU8785314.1 competence pheromone ComX [Bacillus glycinifermentans]NUJ19074.1 competence pheromone ComX [Bacillus glycinifermentans]
MQEIVNFLVQHPEVLEQVINGNACLLGLDIDQLMSIIDGFKLLESSIGRPVPFWRSF